MEINEFVFVDFWDTTELNKDGTKETFPLFNNNINSSITIPSKDFHRAKILNEEDFLKKYWKLKSKGYFIHDGENNELVIE